MRARTLLGACLLPFLMGCATTEDVLDCAATLKARDQLLYEYSNRIVVLSKLCDRHISGMPADSVAQLLKAIVPEQEPFEKEGGIHSLWLSVGIDSTEQ